MAVKGIRRRGRLDSVGGYALGVAAGWNVANIGAVTAATSHAYDVSLATVGFFTTALFLGHLAAQIPGGAVCDRFGGRRTGGGALFLISIGGLIAMTTPDAWVAMLGRAVTGLGTGAAFVAGNACVREAGGGAKDQGVFGGMSVAAGGLALATVPLLETVVGWRAPYASTLVIALPAALVLRVCTPANHGMEQPKESPAAVLTVIADRRLRRVTVVYAASFGLSVVTSNWTAELLTRTTSLGTTSAGVIAGLTLMAGIVSRPLGGWILGTHPAATRAGVGVSLLACSIATAALALGSPLVAVAACLVLGLGAGVPFSPSMSGAARLWSGAPGTAVGVVNSFAIGVVVIGTPLLALAFSLPGDGRIGFLVVAALWLVAAAARPSALALGVPGPEANDGENVFRSKSLSARPVGQDESML